MKKLLRFPDPQDNDPDYLFECPACGNCHGLWINRPHRNGSQWALTGTLENPTVTPSLNSYSENKGKTLWRCHSIITDGKIHFVSDSTHRMAGQTVELPVIDIET